MSALKPIYRLSLTKDFQILTSNASKRNLPFVCTLLCRYSCYPLMPSQYYNKFISFYTAMTFYTHLPRLGLLQSGYNWSHLSVITRGRPFLQHSPVILSRCCCPMDSLTPDALKEKHLIETQSMIYNIAFVVFGRISQRLD